MLGFIWRACVWASICVLVRVCVCDSCRRSNSSLAAASLSSRAAYRKIQLGLGVESGLGLGGRSSTVRSVAVEIKDEINVGRLRLGLQRDARDACSSSGVVGIKGV